jgi:opacity protein-like surface antigen
MKPITKLFLLAAGCACAALPSRLTAQEWQNRVYCKFDGGAVWLHSTSVKDFFGAVPPDTRVDFETGPRLGVALGYHATDWCAVELETGFMNNPIKSLTGAVDPDASVFTVPMMLNATFQLPNRSRFTPYIGAGVGGNSSVLDVDHIDYFGTFFSGTASDVVFAAQAFAGFRVALNDNMGLGLEYRFIHSAGPSYEIDSGVAFNLFSDHVTFGDMNMHVASIRFDVTF